MLLPTTNVDPHLVLPLVTAIRPDDIKVHLYHYTDSPKFQEVGDLSAASALALLVISARVTASYQA